MIYIYDQTLEDDPHITGFERYGVKFKLEKKFLMGKMEYYSFIHPGFEKILVIPGFARQYKELEKRVNKLAKNKDYGYYKNWVLKNLNKLIEEEEIPTDEAESGSMLTMGFDYKDLHVVVEYLNGGVRLSKEFEIRDNNIFGNGIVVNMDLEEI